MQLIVEPVLLKEKNPPSLHFFRIEISVLGDFLNISLFKKPQRVLKSDECLICLTKNEEANKLPGEKINFVFLFTYGFLELPTMKSGSSSL